MVKAIAGSIVVVLLVGATAFGQIGNISNDQNWTLGLGNTTTVASGIATAGNFQNVDAIAIQTGGSTTGTFAGQGAGGLLVQSSSIGTAHAPMSTTQGLDVAGVALVDPVTLAVIAGPGQTQSVDLGTGEIDQFEGTQMTGTQSLDKEVGGQGASTANQSVGFAMGQLGTNTTSGAGQGALIIGTQTGGIAGGAASAGSVNGSMTATIVQQQSVN